MVSITLFPCLFTGGAGIVGQLIHSLHLRVYTDEMLFADIAQQFGIPEENLSRYLFKERSLKHLAMLMEFALAERKKTHNGRYLFYGVHTALLHSQMDKVLKILVTDTQEQRIRRAMFNEHIGEKVARRAMLKHDEKSCRWTKFLLQKTPSDPSLYDKIILCGEKGTIEIANQIIALRQLKNGETAHQPQYPLLLSIGY
jgi:cytidylate kinase